MARKVILDVDPGIDDAVAVALALFDPRLDVLAVTATGGNVAPQQATVNIQTIVEQLDPPRLPRLGAAPLDSPLPEDGRQLHGGDGLGNAGFPVAELHNMHPAEKVLCDEVRAAPEEVTIIASGPLTNIAHAMQRDPSFASMVGRLVIVGGSVTGQGNVTPAAEFNMFCDPLSARLVLRSRMTKTLVPLEVTSQYVMTYDLFDQLPAETTRIGAFLRRILPFAFRSHRQVLGLEGIYLDGVLGIVAATDPELFETHDMAGDVETQGELTAGATVFDRRQARQWRSNMDVVANLDLAAVKDCILRVLAEAARAG
jgi:inosine-uridine nucleoside N-ribohydrolase